MKRQCFYCGQRMTRKRHAINRVTEDHVIPKSRGGTYGGGNIVKACARCNQEKANRTLEEYRKIIATRLGIELAKHLFFGERAGWR